MMVIRIPAFRLEDLLGSDWNMPIEPEQAARYPNQQTRWRGLPRLGTTVNVVNVVNVKCSPRVLFLGWSGAPSLGYCLALRTQGAQLGPPIKLRSAFGIRGKCS